MEISARNVGIVAVVIVLLVGGAAWWLSLPRYGEVSDKGYDYALALYSACNRKNAEKVEVISGMVDQSEAAGELSAAEADWLGGIIQAARDEQWSSASAAVRLLMEEQAQHAATLPPLD